MVSRSQPDIAIVTGVSRGLGEALALAFLARGFDVAGVGRTDSTKLSSERYRFVGCDLSEPTAIREPISGLFASLAGAAPRRVMLINNAATAGPTGVAGRFDHAAFERSIALNLLAPAIVADLFCSAFVDASAERVVVNVSSGAAQNAIAGAAPYCAAKAGLEMLTRVLAVEHDSPTFKAVNLRPGVVDTEMQRFMRTQPRDALPSRALFEGFHAHRELVAPDVAANKIVAWLVAATLEGGRTYSYRELQNPA